MCTELFFVSQPARGCKAVKDIKIASKMNPRQWQRLRALAIDAAARFLDTQLRYEHQDPEMVRLFYQAVHATWPEVAAKYPNSWVLVWYLKIYLLKRVYRKRWSDKAALERAGRQARQQPRRLCTKGTSFRQLDAGASQACVAMRTRRRTTVYDRLASPSGPEITASLAMHCSSAIVPQNTGSLSSPASVHSHSIVPIQSSRAVFRFLDSMSPSLVKLVPDFLSAGIYDQSHLEDFFTWPEVAQRNFLLKTMIGKMNALELESMLLALNSRRHG